MLSFSVQLPKALVPLIRSIWFVPYYLFFFFFFFNMSRSTDTILFPDSCMVRQETHKPVETSSPFNDFLIDFDVCINKEVDDLFQNPSVFYRFVGPRDLLIGCDTTTSWSTLSNILSQMMVPSRSQPFIIEELLRQVREIAKEPQNLNRKTIQLFASLTVGPDVPLCPVQLDEFHDHPVLRFTADRVKDCKDPCAICLEECGSAVRLRACEHIFHENCILKWFQKRYVCPMCRCNIYAIWILYV